MNCGLLIKTYFYGVKVGVDQFGNTYYRHKNNAQKRWVLFARKVEASAIPPEWHAFLHHLADAPLSDDLKRSFQKPHTPNMTGTKAQNIPSTPIEKASTYSAWSPKS